jgi:kinesin family protein C1
VWCVQGHEGVEDTLGELRGEVLALTREAEGLKVQLLELPKMSKALAAAEGREGVLETKVEAGEIARRELHNKLQELRGNVRVYARVRPFLPSDGLGLAEQLPAVTALADERSLLLKSVAYAEEGQQKLEQRNDEQFSFDRSFAGSSSQGQVFEEVSTFVQSALDGFDTCIFSYGQTGSGKTHTMAGSGVGEMRGIVPRAVEQILTKVRG